MLSWGRQAGVVDRRDLQRDGRVRGHDTVPTVLPLLLQLFRSAEDPDVRLQGRIIEQFVRCGELRYAVEGEVHLQVASAMVDPREPLADVVGHRGRRTQRVDREIRCNTGDYDRRGDRRAVLQADTGDAAVDDLDLLHLG